MTNLCIECKKSPIDVKKRRLCLPCYQKIRRELLRKNGTIEAFEFSPRLHIREMEFVKNYFTHNNWFYNPVIFRLKSCRYEPDFYDNDRNVFIEVAGTRQAFEANKLKYLDFIKTFPHIKFEIRKYTGELIDVNAKQQFWQD